MSKTSATDDHLIPSPFLFRFAVPCRRTEQPWTFKGLSLDESYRLPSFAGLDRDDDAEPWADVRMAWSDAGLAINLRTTGKRQPPWCRDSRIEDSDGLRLWIDTRDTHNVHRANRFCHEFCFLPLGGGGKLDEPVAGQMLIDRAKEQASAAPRGSLHVRSEKRVDGYLLEAFISKDALTGYDPSEHQRLGFHYVVNDRELGEQPLTIAGEFPYAGDPSLWSTLELV